MLTDVAKLDQPPCTPSPRDEVRSRLDPGHACLEMQLTASAGHTLSVDVVLRRVGTQMWKIS